MGVEGMMGMVAWWMWRAQGHALEIPSLRGQRQVDPRAYWSTSIISRFKASKRHCLKRKNNLKKKDNPLPFVRCNIDRKASLLISIKVIIEANI